MNREPDTREPDHQVERPEALGLQRQREIFDARDRAIDFRVHMVELQANGADPGELLGAYREITNAYIMQLESLAYGSDKCRELWHDGEGEPLGHVVAHPPDFEDELPRGRPRHNKRHRNHNLNLEPEVIDVIRSLPDLLDAPPYYVKKWRTGIKSRGVPYQEFEKTAEVPIPKDILDLAVRGCNKFLMEIGLELQPGDTSERAEPI